MKFLGFFTLTFGVALSFAVWLHDFRRLRIGANLPHAAPSRLPPELHALAAILSSLGAMMIWWWAAGVAVLLLQPTIAFLMAPLLERLERIARHRNRQHGSRNE